MLLQKEALLSQLKFTEKLKFKTVCLDHRAYRKSDSTPNLTQEGKVKSTCALTLDNKQKTKLITARALTWCGPSNLALYRE